MSKVQKRICTFTQTDLNPVLAKFNQNTVPALAELRPAQPQFFICHLFMIILQMHFCVYSVVYLTMYMVKYNT